jgi:hypothetical protein
MRIVFGTYGQDSPYPFRGSHGEGQDSATDLVQFLMDSQKRISEGALENQQQYLDNYLRNSPVGPTTLAAGDLVLAQHRGETPPSKLAPRLRGPYVIVERTGTNRYSAKHLVTDQIIDVHLDDLKPFGGTQAGAKRAATLDVQINKEYLVDSIVGHKFLRQPASNVNNIRFKIRWAGWGEQYDSWVKFDTVSDLAALDRYVEQEAELRPLVALWSSSGPRSQADLDLGGSGVRVTTTSGPINDSINRVSDDAAPERSMIPELGGDRRLLPSRPQRRGSSRLHH